MKQLLLVLGLVLSCNLMAEDIPMPPIPVIIRIFYQDGIRRLDFNGSEWQMTEDEIDERLKTGFKLDSGLPIRIKTAQDVSFADVIRLYFKYKDLGFKDVKWLIPDPRDQKRNIEAELKEPHYEKFP